MQTEATKVIKRIRIRERLLAKLERDNAKLVRVGHALMVAVDQGNEAMQEEYVHKMRQVLRETR